MSPKRKASDIHEDFKAALPNMIDTLTCSIKKDSNFQDASGNLIISPEQLNLLVYERISLKARKQLHLDRSVVDEAFKHRNQKKLLEIEDVVNEFSRLKHAETTEKFYDASRKIENNIKSLVPPHLSNWTDVGARINILATKKLPQKAALYAVADAALNIHVKSLADQMHKQQAKNLHLESVNTLRSLRDIEQNVVDYDFKYTDQLEAVQGKLYNKMWRDLKSKRHLPSSSLCEFERCGIALMQQAVDSGQQLNISEKKLLANFIEYATDNKELNSRYGKLLKNSIFPTRDKELLSIMHKYAHKTSHIETIQGTAQKLSGIIEEYKKDPHVKIDDKNKVPLYDIGYMYKFNSQDVSNVMNLVDDASASDKMKTYKKLSQKIPKIWDAILPPLQNTSLKDGDLVVDVSKALHAVTHHSRPLRIKAKDWVTPIGHAATGFNAKKGPFLSHIDEKYTREKLDNLTPLARDILHVTPINLIDPKIVDKYTSMTQRSRDEFATSLETQYSALSRKLHNSIHEGIAQGAVINNSSTKQHAAAIASIVPLGLGNISMTKASTWANRILCKTDAGLNLGNILARDSNPKGDKTGTMICSGFAAKMTVITLAELNRQLTAQIRDVDPTFKLPKEGVIKIPFGRMNLDKVTPAVLVTHLKEKNAVKEVKQKGLAQVAIRR